MLLRSIKNTLKIKNFLLSTVLPKKRFSYFTYNNLLLHVAIKMGKNFHDKVLIDLENLNKEINF